MTEPIIKTPTPPAPPAAPAPAAPDAKDWTWVLTQRCTECGFDASTLPGDGIAPLVLDSITRWQDVLTRDDVATRPAAEVWSGLEYACHVRDVFRIFDGRVSLMIDQEDPVFANWDQDDTAIADRYWSRQPGEVSAELAEAGQAIATRFAAVRDDQWQRPGRRSNGSAFTVLSLGQYFAHDVVHHLYDVRG